MTSLGHYLYGLTHKDYRPRPDLRGLRKMPLRMIVFEEVAAVVSPHPVQPLMPLRINLEPHHRVVRQISGEVTLLPAAFGHISDSTHHIVAVLRNNYDEIRDELARMAGKCEMGLKVSWNVPNIFEFFVRQDAELRALRDRTFTRGEPAMADKLRVGETFAAKLAAERERLSAIVMRALQPVTGDVVHNVPRDEKTVCTTSILIARDRADDFADALRQAAAALDANFALECTGPWPPYSFVRLHLQLASAAA